MMFGSRGRSQRPCKIACRPTIADFGVLTLQGSDSQVFFLKEDLVHSTGNGLQTIPQSFVESHQLREFVVA